MITMTQAAATHIRSLVDEDARAGAGLRIFIDKGGCSGMQYNMTIDLPQADDLQVSLDGAMMYVDKPGLEVLAGSVIDYEDGLTNAGFRIRNPNAKQTCGCGTSFEA
jgi:iron-sulfur cluster assembly accessory protein